MSGKSPEQLFNPGDIVYCVGGEPNQIPVVEKATVDSGLRKSASALLPYHYLVVWDRPDKDPLGEGPTITKLPDELFTRREAECLLGSDLSSRDDIDNLIMNPEMNCNLALSLGIASISLMMRDGAQRFINACARRDLLRNPIADL